MLGFVGRPCFCRTRMCAAANAGAELLRDPGMNAQLQSSAPFRLLICGRLVTGASTFEVIEPANETVLVRCPTADLRQ